MKFSIHNWLAAALFLFVFKNAQAQLFIQNGAVFEAAGVAQIALKNTDFINNGQFNAHNSAIFLLGTGSLPMQIGGSGATVFHDLRLETTGPVVQLMADLVVENQLVFVSGNLDLSGFDLVLGPDGVLFGESETSKIIGPAGGEVVKTANLNAPNSANPGNLGAVLTSSENLGETTVRRGHLPATNGGAAGMTRYFDIGAANNLGLNATLRFGYFDSELNNCAENELEIWKNDGAGWQNLGFSDRDAGLNFVEMDGIGAFSMFTLTDFANALPVELLHFSAKNEAERVVLEWKTASETNNRGFEIERSSDGLFWENIGFENGNGRTTEMSFYFFEDKKPLDGQSFYRLRQMDFDGKSDFSNVVSVNRKKAHSSFFIFPNPTDDGFLTLFFAEKGESKNASLRLLDNSGRLVKSLFLTDEKSQKLDLSALPTGVFWLEMTTEKGRAVEKIIRQ